jgi:hypothetical protein
MKEVDLVWRKARSMNAGQIREELRRISNGIARAASPGAIKRYQTRRDIFEEQSRRLYQSAIENRKSKIPS